MSCTYTAPIAGSLLRWAGLLFVVIAVVGGIVGMHGINGAWTASIVTGGSGHTAIAVDGMAVQATPASAPTALECAPPVDTATPGMQGFLHEADCSPAECTDVMAMHESCIPNVSSPVLNVPVPGTLSIHARGAAFALVTGPKAADRIPDPPSLEKLSISRT